MAVREFRLKPGHGSADYLLYVNQKAAGVVEAKPEGSTLTGVEVQSEKYSTGLPDSLPAHNRPLPFLYESTGAETQFTNRLDPEPRSRLVFSFHTPATLASWIGVSETPGSGTQRIDEERSVYLAPHNLRQRLQAMPPLNTSGLWPVQERAIRKLEESLAAGRPRALVQMATGSGKTFMACNQVYRLIKHGGAKRVLFLVDRSNLGRQTLREFQGFTTPDEGRKFTELYNVQLLQSGRIDPVSRVCIATIQRVYSSLKGEELAPELEELSGFDAAALQREPAPVEYNPNIPIETFDVIITDECHRSIYNLWRQVLEYFDGFLIGLTATPSRQTFGFFQPEPGHGVRPRAGGGRPGERRLRYLQDPHPDHRAGVNGRCRIPRRPARPPDPQGSAGSSWRRTSPTLPTGLTATWWRKTRFAPSSTPLETGCSRTYSPAAGTCQRRSSSQRTTATPTTLCESYVRSSGRATTSARRSPTGPPGLSPKTC